MVAHRKWYKKKKNIKNASNLTVCSITCGQFVSSCCFHSIECLISPDIQSQMSDFHHQWSTKNLDELQWGQYAQRNVNIQSYAQCAHRPEPAWSARMCMCVYVLQPPVCKWEMSFEPAFAFIQSMCVAAAYSAFTLIYEPSHIEMLNVWIAA